MTVEAVRSIGAPLAPGETKRAICPFCNAAHEHSFAVTRVADRPWVLLFNCHRGKCSTSGMVVDKKGATMVLSPDNHTAGLVNAESKEMSRHDTHVPGDVQQMLADTYSIGPHTWSRQGVRWEEQGDRICMPWLTENGEQIGWVEKRFDSRWAKSHHELAVRSYQGRLAFPRADVAYTGAKTGTAVLVESLLDAYRLLEITRAFDSLHIHPVALLGAQISAPDAHKVASLFRNVVVLLDPDQWPKGSMRVARAFAALPVQVRMMTMDADPKDASDAAVDSLLNAIGEAFEWNT